MLIGNNDKELRNGYYDIKIEKQGDYKIVISINKLWINRESTGSIDPKYTLYVCKYISEMVNVPLEDITKIICENYFYVMQYKEVDKTIEYENATIKLSKAKNQLTMEISCEK